jgi:hypothetical protein
MSRGEGQITDAFSGRVSDRIGDGGHGRALASFAGAEEGLARPIDHMHIAIKSAKSHLFRAACPMSASRYYA